MNLNKTISLIIFLLYLLQLNAQNSGITGEVLDKKTKKSIPGVTVYLKELNKGTITNYKGQFQLTNLPEGSYTLKTTAIGFEATEQNITLVPNKNINLEIFTLPSIIELNAVTINSKSITGGNENLNKIPGSAHYLTPKQLDNYSFTDVNRSLKMLPGIQIQEEDGFGLRPNIGMRGSGIERSTKINLMEDGVLAAPAPYAAPAAYYFPTVARMEGIEIIKGSSQIKYGPNTTGGVINLISTSIPTQTNAKLQLSKGSFNSNFLRASAGTSFKQVGFMFETTQFGSDGFKTLPNNQTTGFNKQDYLAKIRFNTKHSAKIYQSVTFKIGSSNEVSDETYLGLNENDFNQNAYQRYVASSNDKMKANQQQFSATHIAVINQNINLVTTAYFQKFERNWYKLDAIYDSTGKKININNLLQDPNNYLMSILSGKQNTKNQALSIKANNRSYESRGLQTALKYLINQKTISHEIEAGLRIHEDYMDRFQWVDGYDVLNENLIITQTGIPGTESNSLTVANAVSFFAQDKFTWKNLEVTAGFRTEDIIITQKNYGKNDINREGTYLTSKSNRTQIFVPGAGFIYNLPLGHSLFGGIHRGFFPAGSTSGAVPETSINKELGYRFNKNSNTIQIVGYLNNYQNLLGSDLTAAGGSGTTQQFNAGKAQTYGLETMASTILSVNKNIHIPFSANYTYTISQFLNSFNSNFEPWATVHSGNLMPYVPKNHVNISTGFTTYKLNFNIALSYFDFSYTQTGVNQTTQAQIIPSYYLIDASLHYNLTHQFRVFVTANNVTNNVYLVSRHPMGLRPGMPRSLQIGLKWDLN